MKLKDFVASLATLAAEAERLPLAPASRVVLLSDLHLGDGSAGDDGLRNAPLVAAALERWYEPRGHLLVLNGDVEELHKFRLEDIMARHRELYAVLDRFAARGALRKLVGNHDLALLLRKDYPYRLGHALRLEWKGRPLLAYHGHQAAKFFVEYNYLSDFIVRYLANPLRIRNADIPMDSRRRFKAERRVYLGSRRLGLVSLIGHTHRPLFESLSKYDRLRYAVESLLARYASAPEEARAAIAAEVRVYAAEFRRAARTKGGRGAARSLYAEEDVLVPCLFNSGCATGKTGFTALEVADGRIALVHWTRPGAARPYLEREALSRELPEGAGLERFVIAEEALDQVFARIELLGPESGTADPAP